MYTTAMLTHAAEMMLLRLLHSDFPYSARDGHAQPDEKQN